MAQGKKPPDLRLQSDIDLATCIPRMMAYVLGDVPRLSDEGKPEITIPQLCTFMEAMLLQLPKHFPKGQVRDIQERVRKLTEICFAHSYARAAEVKLLEDMRASGDIDEIVFQRRKDASHQAGKIDHRDCVALVIELHQGIHRERKPAHRPEGHSSRDEADSEILRRTFEKVELHGSISDVKRKLRETISEALESGELKPLGVTKKESIDTHSKRIRRKLSSWTRDADEN
jgi:hypothetical protein